MRPWPAPLGGLRLRPCKALAALAALVALAGCDTLVVGKVDPAMFPAAAAASAPTMTGRAALELPPAVRGHMQPGPDMCAIGRARLQLPLGATTASTWPLRTNGSKMSTKRRANTVTSSR